MYAEFIEQFHGYPQVVIAPKKPEPFMGCIFVTPLHLDLDSGRYTIRASVDANVTLGSMTCEIADEWANALGCAASIANRRFLPWFNDETMRAALALWNRVDELMGKHETAPAES